MKSILLIGLGRFGKHIAIELNKLNHQVMAVDIDEERVEAALPFVTGAQIGDSTNEEFLYDLGVRNFDVCIVAIGTDFQSSLETAYLLKEQGAQKVVARASRDVQEKFLLRNGADEVVYPEKDMAKWTAIRYGSDNILDYIEMEGDYAIFEMTPPEDWEGERIDREYMQKKYDLNLMAIKHNGEMMPPANYDGPLEKDDILMIFGKYEELRRCF